MIVPKSQSNYDVYIRVCLFCGFDTLQDGGKMELLIHYICVHSQEELKLVGLD